MSDTAVVEKRRYHLFIGGEWLDPLSQQTFESIDPFANKSWAVLPDGDVSDVDRAVRAARGAFDEGPWGRMTGTDRARLLRKLGDLLARDADDLALCETRDNGKLLREMRAQCQRLPEWYYYFAGAADKIQGDVIPSDKPDFLVYTRHEPIGVVGIIVPWNSPLFLLTWKLAPALAAGCTVVVKPSEQTPVSALEFAKRFEEAGFPPGVLNVVTGSGASTGAALVSHPEVDKVAFTGSTRTGQAIVRASAENLSRVSLELGGKSPNIVFEDADLKAAVNGVIAGIFAATGQTCIAGSRLLVHEDIHDTLVEQLLERTKTIKLGDPTLPETEMGPVAYRQQMDQVLEYVRAGLDEGAELACGGKPSPDLGGLFVQPTIFTGVRNDMKICREEIFGPVLAVISFRDEEEAIAIANDTRFGLGAGVWTKDIHRAHRVAHRLRAGTVWINAYRTVSFNTPFGGYKMSGWGRENGLESVREFTETKSIWVELSNTTRDPFTIG